MIGQSEEKVPHSSNYSITYLLVFIRGVVVVKKVIKVGKKRVVPTSIPTLTFALTSFSTSI